MSLSSFLPTVPLPGAALCSAGSLGSVPQLPRSYCGTPTSRLPASLGFVAPLRSSGFPESARSPWFLGDPCIHALVMDPGGAPRSGPRLVSLRFERCADAFHDKQRVGPTTCPPFEADSHGLHARCLRFAAHLAVGHARLASGWRPPALAGRDSHPRVATIGFSRYMSSSDPRLCLAQA